MVLLRRVYNLSFFTKNDREKYGDKPIIYLNDDGDYRFNDKIKKGLVENDYFFHLIKDIVNSALERSKKYDQSLMLTRYEKYSRRDACKLLNWKDDESATMFGYKPKYNTCPIFVTYHKHNEVESSVDYGDEFISTELFKWYTRSNRTIKSPEVQKIIHANENNMTLYLFVKKDDDEGKGFYFLGEMLPDKNTIEQDTMKDKKGKEIPVVHMDMILDKPIDHNLYHYIIEDAQ